MSNHSCLFCQIREGQADASLVYEDELAIAFMDLYPVRRGHVLIIPKQHAERLSQLDQIQRSHLFELANAVINAQIAVGLPADGANLVVNDGKAANQHIPHVHIHVLPRKQGDLMQVGATFATRMVNVFGKQSKRRALDQLAKQLNQTLEFVG